MEITVTSNGEVIFSGEYVRHNADFFDDNIDWLGFQERLVYDMERRPDFADNILIHFSNGRTYAGTEYMPHTGNALETIEAEKKREHYLSDVAEYGPAFEAYVETTGYDYYLPGQTSREFADAYCGEWDSLEEYVQNYYDSTGLLDDCPPELSYYINWQGLSDEWYMGGYWTEPASRNTVFIYRPV